MKPPEWGDIPAVSRFLRCSWHAKRSPTRAWAASRSSPHAYRPSPKVPGP